MKRYILIFLLLASLLEAGLLSACGGVAAQDDPSTQSPTEQATSGKEETPAPPPKGSDQLDGAVITFHLSGGLAGVDQTWTIYPDGRWVDPKGGEHTVDAAQVTALLDDIETLGFFDMKDSYGQFSQCNDCFTYTLTVSSGGKVKTITTKEGAKDTPPELVQILAKINALVIKP
jgi:hypothetical protein